jgi:hypothetical protein
MFFLDALAGSEKKVANKSKFGPSASRHCRKLVLAWPCRIDSKCGGGGGGGNLLIGARAVVFVSRSFSNACCCGKEKTILKLT